MFNPPTTASDWKGRRGGIPNFQPQQMTEGVENAKLFNHSNWL